MFQNHILLIFGPSLSFDQVIIPSDWRKKTNDLPPTFQLITLSELLHDSYTYMNECRPKRTKIMHTKNRKADTHRYTKNISTQKPEPSAPLPMPSWDLSELQDFNVQETRSLVTHYFRYTHWRRQNVQMHAVKGSLQLSQSQCSGMRCY